MNPRYKTMLPKILKEVNTMWKRIVGKKKSSNTDTQYGNLICLPCSWVPYILKNKFGPQRRLKVRNTLGPFLVRWMRKGSDDRSYKDNQLCCPAEPSVRDKVNRIQIRFHWFSIQLIYNNVIWHTIIIGNLINVCVPEVQRGCHSSISGRSNDRPLKKYAIFIECW